MSGLIIDSTCVGCGLCIDTCSFDALKLNNKKVIVGETCTLCGVCLGACPFNAMRIEKEEAVSDLTMYKDIYVFIEHDAKIREVSYELLGKARHLADNYCVIYIHCHSPK